MYTEVIVVSVKCVKETACISSSLCTNVCRGTSSGPEVSKRQKGKEVLSGLTRYILEYAAIGYAEVIAKYRPHNKTRLQVA